MFHYLPCFQSILRKHLNTGLCNAKSCVPVIGIVVMMISSKLFLRRHGNARDLKTVDGLINIYLRNKHVFQECLTKKITNLLISSNFCGSYITSTISFLEKDSLDRNVRSFKLKYHKDKLNKKYWKPYLDSIGYNNRDQITV